MARVTELERLLTQISGLLGPVKDITRVSVIANSSQSNEVLNRKRIHPYFHLVTSTGFLKSERALYIANAPSKDIISEPHLQQWSSTSGSSRTPCQIEEIELELMLTRPALLVPSEKGKSVALNVTMSRCSQLMALPVPATLETVAMVLEKTMNLDFDQFFKKKQSQMNSRSLHHPFNIQRP